MQENEDQNNSLVYLINVPTAKNYVAGIIEKQAQLISSTETEEDRSFRTSFYRLLLF